MNGLLLASRYSRYRGKLLGYYTPIIILEKIVFLESTKK